jgi:hypothetical protein
MPRTSRRERALNHLKWDANISEHTAAVPTRPDDSKSATLSRGSWAAFLGETKSSKRSGVYRREIWYGQVMHVRRASYKVRYAIKRPITLKHVETTCHIAPASAVIERIDNIASHMQWCFNDPLVMLIAAAECTLP